MVRLVDRPVGVFDSGIGGLTVVRAIIDRMRPAHTSFDVVNGVEGDGLRTETADSFIEVTGIGA